MLTRIATGLTALLALSVLAACGSDDEVPDTTDSTPTASAPAEEPETPDDDADSTDQAAGACSYGEDGRPAAKQVDPPPADPTETGEVAVTISTSAGDIPVTLDAASAPCTVNSFLSLADQGYFDATDCHRLTTGGIFVLQCGDPSGTGAGGPGYSYADEVDGTESYETGTLAMANAGADTNGSQFFLVYDDSTGLPPNYTVFGSIDADGIEVVQAIAAKGTADGGGDGAPAETVTINAVER